MKSLRSFSAVLVSPWSADRFASLVVSPSAQITSSTASSCSVIKRPPSGGEGVSSGATFGILSKFACAVFVALFAALFLSVPAAKADTVSWIGNGVESFWAHNDTNVFNWSTGAPPAAGDIALFDDLSLNDNYDVTISVSTVLSGIFFDGAGYSPDGYGYTVRTIDIAASEGIPAQNGSVTLLGGGTTGILVSFSGTGIRQELSLSANIGSGVYTFGNWTPLADNNWLVLTSPYQRTYSAQWDTTIILSGIGRSLIGAYNFGGGSGHAIVESGEWYFGGTTWNQWDLDVNGGVLVPRELNCLVGSRLHFGTDGGPGGTLRTAGFPLFYVPTISSGPGIYSGVAAGTIENGSETPSTIWLTSFGDDWPIYAGLIQDGLQDDGVTPSAPLNVVKSWGNGQRIAGNNTYTGYTWLRDGGVLEPLTPGALGVGPIIFGGWEWQKVGEGEAEHLEYLRFDGGYLNLGRNGNFEDYSLRFTNDIGQTWNINVENSVTFSGTLASEGGRFRKEGWGEIILAGPNTYDGWTWARNGTLTVYTLNSIGEDGPLMPSSSLGAPTSQETGLIFVGENENYRSALNYVGPGETSNRNIQLNGCYRDKVGQAFILNNGTGPLNLTGTLISSQAGGGATYFAGRSAELGEVSGVIADSVASGQTSLFFSGGSVWRLSGENTYTGITRVEGGVLEVSSLNSITTSPMSETGGRRAFSSLGAPTNENDGRIGIGITYRDDQNHATSSLGYWGGYDGDSDWNPVLRYIGTGETTDRAVGILSPNGGGTIEMAGTGLLKFLNWWDVNNSNDHVLFLTGNTSGTGEIAGNIGLPLREDGVTLGNTYVRKYGSGEWVLSGNNTYNRETRIYEGILSVSANNNLGDHTATYQNNEGGTVYGNYLQLSGGTLRATETFDLDRNTILDWGTTNGIDVTAGHTLSLTRQVSGDGSATLNKTGAGTLAITAGFSSGEWGFQLSVTEGDIRFDETPTAGFWNLRTITAHSGGTLTSPAGTSAPYAAVGAYEGVWLTSDATGGGAIAPGGRGGIGVFQLNSWSWFGTYDTVGHASLAIDLASGSDQPGGGISDRVLAAHGDVKLFLQNITLDLSTVGDCEIQVGDFFFLAIGIREYEGTRFVNAPWDPDENQYILESAGWTWAVSYTANWDNGNGVFGTNTGYHDLAIQALAAVPEPGTWAMIVGGLGALTLLRRRKA